MRRTTLIATAAFVALALGASAAAAQPAAGHGSCAEFGANVAFLATTLGPTFGQAASTVASSGPEAFPTLVVGPEQTLFCEPRP
jgi:hypothetical protein